MIFSSHDTSFFDSFSTLSALILPYFAFILPFYFPFSLLPFLTFSFPFFLFFYISSFFFLFSYFPPQMTSVDISPGGASFDSVIMKICSERTSYGWWHTELVWMWLISPTALTNYEIGASKRHLGIAIGMNMSRPGCEPHGWPADVRRPAPASPADWSRRGRRPVVAGARWSQPTCTTGSRGRWFLKKAISSEWQTQGKDAATLSKGDKSRGCWADFSSYLCWPPSSCRESSVAARPINSACFSSPKPWFSIAANSFSRSCRLQERMKLWRNC